MHYLEDYLESKSALRVIHVKVTVWFNCCTYDNYTKWSVIARGPQLYTNQNRTVLP